jgi:hypothetical protein
MAHTPLDFLLSGALIGTMLTPPLTWLVQQAAHLRILHSLSLSSNTYQFPVLPATVVAILWIANQVVRLVRLRTSRIFEERATAELLNTKTLRPVLVGSFLFALAAGVLAFAGIFAYASVAALASVLLSRYLFFVSVVPLNMALTFTQGGPRS